MRDLGDEAGLLGISQRRPPANDQAEYALLGSIFANSRALYTVVEFLRPEHFVLPLHGRIYTEASRRILAGGVADPISLKAWFEGDAEAHTVGGPSYLAQLLAAMVGVINAREYGQAILDCWQRRAVIAIGEDLVNGAFAGSSDDTGSSLISTTIDKLDGVAAGAGEERKATTWDAAMDAAIAGMEQAMQGGGPVGLSTGMKAVDDALGGLEKQTMTVVAGRPGMGKSALAIQWAVSVARAAREQHRAGGAKAGVLVVSLEMSAPQLARRILAWVANTPGEAIRKGHVSQDQVDRIVQARHEMAGLPLSIEDCSGLSMGMIRLKARAARRRHGLSLVVIDHLHIVRPDAIDVRNGQTAAIGKISNSLKQLAKEFDCPVVALAQLNRGLESRDDKRPTLADLRQAGEIEQDADAVAFIYRGEYYLPKGDLEQHAGETQAAYADRCARLEDNRRRLHGRAELILEKVREGQPRTIPLLWHGATTSFSEPTE